IRLVFCFSRVWSRYSLSLGRLRPCSPGGYGRISIGHLGESHLAPLRNSLVFSRRQRLQSAPVYRAISVINSSSDPAPLWRAAAIVRDRGDVLDGPDLQASGRQRADRRLATRARTLHEHVDLAHAVLHRPPRCGLGGHLGGERRRLTRALKPDLSGRGPGDHATAGIGDRDDRVVEGALDVRMAMRDVLAFLPADLLGGAGGTASGRHSAPRSSGGGRTGCSSPARWAQAACSGLLLAGLLLAGHSLLLALAGTGVGLGALAVHRQSTTMPDTLVAPNLDLAPDVGLHLPAQVTLDLVVGLNPVTQVNDVFVGELVHPGVAADAGSRQRLERPGTADAVDVGERDLQPLITRQVDANEACHDGQISFSVGRSCAPLRVPARTRPRPPPGAAPRTACRVRGSSSGRARSPAGCGACLLPIAR